MNALVLGEEAAEDLMTWMQRLDTARNELPEQVRADFAELRQEMRAGFAQLDAKIEKRSADLIKWSFVFWVGAVGAIAALAGVLR